MVRADAAGGNNCETGPHICFTGCQTETAAELLSRATAAAAAAAVNYSNAYLEKGRKKYID